MRLYVTLVLIAGLMSASCSNKKDSNEPEVPTTITINVPVTSGIYFNSTALRTEGEMSDNNVLATAKVEIKNTTSGAILFQQSSSTGNVSFYRFDWTWTVSGITGPTPATVKVTAIDKLGNEVSKTVAVTLDN